jgi:hypothetical protein
MNLTRIRKRKKKKTLPKVGNVIQELFFFRSKETVFPEVFLILFEDKYLNSETFL